MQERALFFLITTLLSTEINMKKGSTQPVGRLIGERDES
jgi:hypothetical protein